MLRLVILIILFLASLLCVFRAPMFKLWYLAIIVTEFPLLTVGLTVLFLLWGFRVERFAMPGTIVGLVALAMFASPVVRAYWLAGKLNTDFEAAFGKGSATLAEKPGAVPFSFAGLITGINNRKAGYMVQQYKMADGAAYTFDYYKALATGLRPCLIVIHGGSWAGGDSRQLPELNSYLANAGYNVASINYRLAPRYCSPLPVADVYEAIAFMKAHSQELMIDTTKFVLLGRSAGAQIACVAAYQKREPSIKGVINIYGPADMIWGYKHPNSPFVMNSCKVMEDYLGGTYGQVPQKYAESSPVELVAPGIPPTLIIHGIIDPLVAYQHSPRLVDKLQKAGAQYYMLTLPWGTHGCDYTLNGPSGQLSTYAIERFMRVVTR